MSTTGSITLDGCHAVDRLQTAMEEMERYCAEHPRSPTAMRHPQLSIRGRTVIALLGRSLEEGIAGFGDNVAAALRAFDVQYRCALRSTS